jgi:hypothetical protein
VQYPELLPLCSLDALCLARLAAAAMARFNAGGVLDTSSDLAPLRELLGHGLVGGGSAHGAAAAAAAAISFACCCVCVSHMSWHMDVDAFTQCCRWGVGWAGSTPGLSLLSLLPLASRAAAVPLLQVEMGPAAVRVQAALEAAVYTTVMSPPSLPCE